MIDFFNAIIRKRFNLGEEFRWSQIEAIDGGTLVTYGKTVKTKTGETKWERPLKRAIVSDAELQQAKDDYETETGKCYICEGTVQERYGWSITAGAKFRPCKRCNSTGKAPEKMNIQVAHATYTKP